MKKYIYKCFSTPSNKYIYVRDINSIIRISEEEYQELLSADEDTSPVIKKYVNMGILVENPVKKIEHPETEILGFMADHLCEQLTLQVTQQCNLRCEYCAYSGLYDNRVHADKNMDFQTAKKAIDFFLRHSRDSKQIVFGFYGGEPLLRFPLIKQCVEYIEANVEGKDVKYSITTNGTLLNDEIVDFFVLHHVLLSISLDGSKEEHDLHRRFQSGRGSFDVIMENVRRLKERYPEYGKELAFVPVITPNGSLEHVLQYFTTDELLKDNMTSFNTVTTVGMKKKLDKKEKYDEDDFNLVHQFEYLKVLLSLSGMLDRVNISPLVERSESDHGRFYERIGSHDLLGEVAHHGGPCVPGVARIFVTVDGVLYPCEKVSETNLAHCIGDINQGFDLQKMEDMLNLGRVTQEECKECWNLPNCTICAAKLESGADFFDKNAKLVACNEELETVMNYIYETAVLSEFGYIQEWNGVRVYE